MMDKETYDKAIESCERNLEELLDEKEFMDSTIKKVKGILEDLITKRRIAFPVCVGDLVIIKDISYLRPLSISWFSDNNMSIDTAARFAYRTTPPTGVSFVVECVIDGVALISDSGALVGYGKSYLVEVKGLRKKMKDGI